jgi:predicted esterase
MMGWVLLGVLFMITAGCQTSAEQPESGQEDISVLLEPANDEPTEGGDNPVRNPGKSYEQMVLIDETVIEYALVLPDNYSAGQRYPILLALPPGDQTEAMVEAGLGYWEREAADRGWIAVSPVAPNRTLYFRGSETYLPEFLGRIAEQFLPEGGKFHVAGVSNGGISAFRFAIGSPELVHSIVVLPGYPLDGFDQQNLVNLQDIPIAMFVGENDTAWVSRMEAAEQALSDLGAAVTLEIESGEGHVIRSLSGERLFDLLESFRLGGS